MSNFGSIFICDFKLNYRVILRLLWYWYKYRYIDYEIEDLEINFLIIELMNYKIIFYNLEIWK